MTGSLGKVACHTKSFLKRCYFGAATIGYAISHVSCKDLVPSQTGRDDLMLQDIICQCGLVLDKNTGIRYITADHLAVTERLLRSVEGDLLDLGSFGRFELVGSTLVLSDTKGTIPVLLYEFKGSDGSAFLFWGGLYALPLLLVNVAQRRVYLFQDSYNVQPTDWSLSAVNLLLTLRRRQLRNKIHLLPIPRKIKGDATLGRVSISERILLFGFSNNFGHYLWNELSGVYDLLESGLMDRINCVVVGQYDFCGFAKLLESRYDKKVCYVPLHGAKPLGDIDADVMKMLDRKLLIRFNDIVLTDSYCQFLRNNLADVREEADISGEPTATADIFNVCIKVRLHNRVCQNQLELLRAFLGHFSKDPKIITQFRKRKVRLFVDGFSSYTGMSRYDEDVVRSEKELFAEFAKVAATIHGDNIELVDMIGLKVSQKASIARCLDLYISPVGSGGELYTWIYKVPSIYYGTPTMIELAQRHAQGIVESLPWIALVEAQPVGTQGGSLDNYLLDLGILLREVSVYCEAFAEKRGAQKLEHDLLFIKERPPA